MAFQLRTILIKALGQLEQERAHLDRQIASVQAVLGRSRSRKSSAVKPRSRNTRKMSAAARKRISQRMRKYWADRKKAAAKVVKKRRVSAKPKEVSTVEPKKE